MSNMVFDFVPRQRNSCWHVYFCTKSI